MQRCATTVCLAMLLAVAAVQAHGASILQCCSDLPLPSSSACIGIHSNLLPASGPVA
jgi:hypothetical protein